jgi:hypothetical protein
MQASGDAEAMVDSKHYVIRGGLEGRERLRISVTISRRA